MSEIIWDKADERTYETGVDHGVLYIPDAQGVYANGVPWNGLTAITENPTGAEATPIYADNIKYLNLISAEDFGATLEALTFPKEFSQFEGVVEVAPGVFIGQQNRGAFGLHYRTLIGDAIQGTAKGYKLHLVYGAQAAPSSRANSTVNETPTAMPFSWELTTSAVEVPGFKPSATMTFDSTLVDPDALALLESILFGTAGEDPRLPLPSEVIEIMGAGVPTEVEPLEPQYNATTKAITIPARAGVIYSIDGAVKAAGVLAPITKDTLVTAKAAPGFKFPAVTDTDWLYEV
jgi:hypothetical protein